jgi:hypothetical protein
VIPLPISDFGNWSIRVRASDNGFISTTCEGIANDRNNIDFDRTVTRSTSRVGGSGAVLETLDLGVVTVPREGTLSVECRVPVNGSVQWVDWDN